MKQPFELAALVLLLTAGCAGIGYSPAALPTGRCANPNDLTTTIPCPSPRRKNVPEEQPPEVAEATPRSRRAAPSTATTTCNAALFVDPPQAFTDQERPYGVAKEVADLDADGVPEVLVAYATSATSSGLTLLSRTGDATCFTRLYEGPGTRVSALTKSPRGFVDIEITFDALTGLGWGSGGVVARFDGSTYRWTSPTSCRSFSGGSINADECRELVKQYDPAKSR